MSRILAIPFAFLLTSFFTLGVKAQCTPDNSHTEFGAYSSLGKNKLPNAWVDSTFDETVTIVVPATFQGFAIIKVTLKDAPRLYIGLSYSCNPSSCVYLGGSNGCIKISGKPTDPKQANQKTVDLELNIVTDIVTFDTSLAIEFDLLDSASLRVNSPKAIEDFRLFPNPADKKLELLLPAANSSFEITVSDLNGKIVKQFIGVNNESTSVEIITEQYKPGIYFIELKQDAAVIRKKLLIQH